jgi:membrane-bound lytic murein transglycosylase D
MIVESALNPKAVSKMGATIVAIYVSNRKTIWIKIDSYIDERSDPLRASDAAAQYMTNMYKMFGDWDLVLASYNSGPGNVTKAIRRSGGQQNYWNIKIFREKRKDMSPLFWQRCTFTSTTKNTELSQIEP